MAEKNKNVEKQTVESYFGKIFKTLMQSASLTSKGVFYDTIQYLKWHSGLVFEHYLFFVLKNAINRREEKHIITHQQIRKT